MQSAMRRTPSAKTSCREGIVTFSGKKEQRGGTKKAKDRKKKGKNLEGGVHAFLFFFIVVPLSPLFVFLRGSESTTRGGCWSRKKIVKLDLLRGLFITKPLVTMP